MVHQAFLELQVHQDHLVHPELQVQQVLREQVDYLKPQVPQVQAVVQVLQVQQVLLVLVVEVKLVELVVHQDQQVLQVQTE